MIQNLIVAVFVLVAALYAASKYLPKAWRERMVYTLSGGTGKGKLVDWLGTGSSCGSGCDTCGTCATDKDELPAQGEGGRKVIKVHLQR
jgi:hypothetical protein